MKWICKECGWIGENILKAPSPFDENDELLGCPDCLFVNNLNLVCEVDGCNKEATCGIPDDTGYVRCCGEHYQKINRRRYKIGPSEEAMSKDQRESS